MTTPGISYQPEALALDDFADILRRSGLAARRPIDHPERLRRMLEASDLVVTAREGQRLVGIARALTDFAFHCYLAELAVDRERQGRGIGRELVRRTRELAGGPEWVSLVLLAAPDAQDFYPRIGMERAGNAYVLPRQRRN